MNNDRIYAVDRNNNRVNIFKSSQGEFIKSFGEFGTGEGQFDKPYGIAVTESNIYVTEQNNDRVQKFDLDGNFVLSFGETGTI